MFNYERISGGTGETECWGLGDDGFIGKRDHDPSAFDRDAK